MYPGTRYPGAPGTDGTMIQWYLVCVLATMGQLKTVFPQGCICFWEGRNRVPMQYRYCSYLITIPTQFEESAETFFTFPSLQSNFELK